MRERLDDMARVVAGVVVDDDDLVRGVVLTDALIGTFARSDTFDWALLVAPVFLVGLVFVPDALRDLVRQALDRRRITVTRIAR